MKSNVMMALFGALILGCCAAAWADDDKECAQYTNVCTGYTCYATSGTCDDNKSFNRITQDTLTLGHCFDGTGSCAETGHHCTVKKYQVTFLDPICKQETLKCTDDAGPFNGCK